MRLSLKVGLHVWFFFVVFALNIRRVELSFVSSKKAVCQAVNIVPITPYDNEGGKGVDLFVD